MGRDDTGKFVTTPLTGSHYSASAAVDSPTRRPRLLVLASTYPRWVNDHEPAFVHELSKRLINRFDVTVLCPHARGALPRENLEGVRVVRYAYAPARWETLVNDGGILGNLSRHPWKWLLLPTFILGQALALARLKFTWRPDVVHAHWLLPQGIVAAGMGVAPLVVTSHGADLFALKNRMFRWMREKVSRRAKVITVVSDVMRTRLKGEVSEVDVRTMPMGVDLDVRFVASSTARSRNTILFVGRLVEKKGLIHLIDAMPEVLAAHPEAHLQVVGFGPERERLLGRVRELALDGSISFLGAMPQTVLPQYYQSASVFVAPFVEAPGGDQEGLGLVVAEAIGCMCPVVVCDVPAVRDFFSDPTDFVVSQRDASAIAEAIIRVLDDPAAAQERSAALRENVRERFSWEAVAGGYADLFGEIIDQSRLDHGR